jgi:hypothetical protein
MKMPIRLSSPMMVPTSLKDGPSGMTGLTIVGGGGSGAAEIVGGGGRREGVNSGRSRVAESLDLGMAHNGLLPLGGSETGGEGSPASGATSTALGARLSISVDASAISANPARPEASAFATGAQDPAPSATAPRRCNILMGFLATVR